MAVLPRKYPKIKFKAGYITDNNNNPIESLEQALALIAECNCGGIDCCYCYETICNAETGALLIRYYIDGEDGPVEVVEEFETGLATVKALYAARA